MRKIIFFPFLLMFWTLEAQIQNSDIISVHDKTFMDDAAETGIAEVEFGKLAIQNGQSAAIKNFGEQMVKDHSKANEELRNLATKKNVVLPALISSSHKQKLDELSSKRGAEFDKSFINQMLFDHESLISMYESYLEKGDNVELKNWANSKIPVLKAHLEELREIVKSVQ